MKTALVSTSINIPKVLQLYRKLDPDVPFFVAGDLKTPPEAAEFCNSIPDCHYLGPDAQRHWKSSELIGWNTDSRRNIAVLEALKWGAEIIVSIDDDMLPIWGTYRMQVTLEDPFSGLMFGMPQQWFDAGIFTTPPAKQRGLPAEACFSHVPDFVVDAKVGMVQGAILGVPDSDAVTALASHPYIHSTTDILIYGFVVHPGAYAVANSQWTAFRAELAPAFMQHYKTQQRNTDILASMLMRRLMRERELYTYFGGPLAYHGRAPRPLFNDLKAEMWGLEHIQEWADYLHRAPIGGTSVTDDCRALVDGCGFLPQEFKDCAFAFYEDCEGAVK
jgi:hypothetical protein